MFLGFEKSAPSRPGNPAAEIDRAGVILEESPAVGDGKEWLDGEQKVSTAESDMAGERTLWTVETADTSGW